MGTETFDEQFFHNLLIQLCAQSADALENEQLEIKGWCRDERELIQKVVDASCCLANARGGHILVGVDENAARKFSPCPHRDVSPTWLVRRIQDDTHPPVSCRGIDLTPMLCEILTTGGPQVYAIVVDRKRSVGGHTNKQGISKIRVGKECRIQYAADDDRTQGVVPDVTSADLSVESIHWAINRHHRSFSPAEAITDPWEFLARARLLQNPDGAASGYDAYAVTLAALILFGKQSALARALPYSQTVLKTDQGHVDLRRNVIESLRELIVAEQARLRQLCPAIPPGVFQELLVNAYMHRCWRSNGPIVISVSSDSVEVENPGDLVPGLHVDSLIYCIPFYRNLLLAEGLRFVGLSDKIGQGIDIVFKSLVCAGLDFPSFESANNRFSVHLNMAQNSNFQEFVRRRGAALPYLDELVMLRSLWNREDATIDQLALALQRDRKTTHRCVSSMLQKSMIEAVDERDSVYRLSDCIRRDIATVFSEDQMALFDPPAPTPT